jgi:hypothetical protein
MAVYGKDQEALMKSEMFQAENDTQPSMYVAPPPPYYAGPAGDASYAPPPVQQAVIIQPQVGIQYIPASAAAQAVPDHLIYAVLATLFCCWPIGLYAIFKSLECRNAINRGDVNQAMQLSRQTRRFANWTIGVGVLFIILSFVMAGIYVWLRISPHMNHMH